MEKQELKKEVERILTSLQKINPKEVSKENGLMDFEKLKARQEVKFAIYQLNKLGISRNYLIDKFFFAGITMGRLLNN